MVRIKISEDFKETIARIKVIGIGGAGGNAVNRMIMSGIKGAEFIATNTDAQALRRSLAARKIQLGIKLTEGLGAGGDPSIGKGAAEESAELIKEELTGSNMLFVTAGMGGGTGTGATPIISQISKSLGILTVAVVTQPFDFEGKIRLRNAELGLKELRNYIDTILIIPNDRLFNVIDGNTGVEEAYLLADDILRQAVQSISDVILQTGEINVDFADVRAIMKDAGDAIMGVGQGKGPGRVLQAIEKAVTSPLLGNLTIEGASKGILVNISGSKDLAMFEIKEGMELISNSVSANAPIYYGQVLDESIGDEVKVTVIATGLTQKKVIEHTTKTKFNRIVDHRQRGVSTITQNKGTTANDIRRPAILRMKNRIVKE